MIAPQALWTLWRAVSREIRFARQRELLRERFPHVIFGEGVIIRAPERFSAGERCFLDTRAYLACGGGEWNGNRGYIRLGINCEIGPYCVFWGAGGITIGDNVHIGANVSITAHEAHHIDPRVTDPRLPLKFDFEPVVIEDHVIVCSGTNIIPGVRIGHHSMIGAGAVVISDIPPYSLAVGVPAKVVKTWDGSGREARAVRDTANGKASVAEKWVP
ncbi:MAG TPA: acyltransferase [Candidatus Acidoferrales bacterium]|nr:acyltransferase [Candidatus Acidoferrales bacterium]